MTSRIDPVRYVVVGTGWRAQFFFRLARAFPDRLRLAGVVSRDSARAAEVAECWGTVGVTTLDEALEACPADFVIAAVPWPQTPGLIRQLVEAGRPVLAETPPAPDLDALHELWDDVGASSLVQVAEQYPRYPDVAAARAVIEAGLIGEVDDVHVASTHMYHAMAIMRNLLGVGLTDATVTATVSQHRLVDPLTPDGWTDDETPQEVSLMRAHIGFPGGQTGLYEFWDNQWWNPVRQDRLAVRGSKGEIVDGRVSFMDGPRTVVDVPLVRRHTGAGLNLEGQDLDHISLGADVVYRNQWPDGRLSDDEIATAGLLESTGLWARGEQPPPYPLEQGAHDWALALACDRSAEQGQTVQLGVQPWM